MDVSGIGKHVKKLKSLTLKVFPVLHVETACNSKCTKQGVTKTFFGFQCFEYHIFGGNRFVGARDMAT